MTTTKTGLGRTIAHGRRHLIAAGWLLALVTAVFVTGPAKAAGHHGLPLAISAHGPWTFLVDPSNQWQVSPALSGQTALLAQDSEDQDNQEGTGPQDDPGADSGTEPAQGEAQGEAQDQAPTDDASADEDTGTGQDGDGEATGEEGDEQSAHAPYGIFQPLMDLVEAGGPIIVILAILSVISFAIVIIKLVQFAVLRVGKRRFVNAAIDKVCRGKVEEALRDVEQTPGVVARVMEAALRGKALGPEAEELSREEVLRVAQAKIEGLDSGLTLLSLIASISPLLGLLGTVLGMIDAFQQLQSAGDRVDPAILSGGIWEALLTTAAGLSVAIPAAAFYTWLRRTVDTTALAMEDAATRCYTASLYEQRSPAQTDAQSVQTQTA